MRIRVKRERYFVPPDQPRVTVHYVPGEYTVRREWGDALVAAGDAVEVDPPTRAKA